MATCLWEKYFLHKNKEVNGKPHFLSSMESSGIVDCFMTSKPSVNSNTIITLEMGTSKLTAKL